MVYILENIKIMKHEERVSSYLVRGDLKHMMTKHQVWSGFNSGPEKSNY